jgi:pimeloyl-ACP methyl ester carboxylesterase
MDFQRIQTNGITLNVACDGPVDGPLVILLHGFPEFWYAWRQQLPALAAAGCRIMAPDLRGYNLSDKPSGVQSYRSDLVADDVIGLIDHAGRAQATIVGHDWGGAVAWVAAMRNPARISRLVILNCAHPATMMKRIRQDSEQRRKSWYIFAFQLPVLPELFARAWRFRALVGALENSSRPGTFSDADIAKYREAWAKPGALTAMINYYRAALRKTPGRGGGSPRVTVPTGILWGVNDAFLTRALAEDSLAYCDQGSVEYVDASHWIQHEAPDRVTQVVLGA